MNEHKTYPMALNPDATSTTLIDESFIDAAIIASRESPRKRIIQPLHKETTASLQRMLNAIQPGSYIQPHRHARDRAESIVVVSGSILFVTFARGWCC